MLIVVSYGILIFKFYVMETVEKMYWVEKKENLGMARAFELRKNEKSTHVVMVRDDWGGATYDRVGIVDRDNNRGIGILMFRFTDRPVEIFFKRGDYLQMTEADYLAFREQLPEVKSK